MNYNFIKHKVLEHIAAWINYPVAHILTFFTTLNKKKYFCMSMSGNSYGDNIKYLAEYISRQDRDAEIVWAFTNEFLPKADCPFKSVRLYSFLYYYHILTSKFILSNARLNQRMLHKRRGQIYLQTWHGTALKRLGIDIPAKKRSRLQHWIKPGVFHFDVSNTDIMISGSRFMTDIFRNSFLFKGQIEETGTPRNDIFFHEHPEIADKVRSYYHIDKDVQIILYAPTFRTDGKFTYYDIDAQQLMELWEKKTDKKNVLLVRLHPNLQYKSEAFIKQFPKGTINASDYPDMQELLYATDLLVTDYSSSMFDFMYTRRPVVLYVPDYETYDRGFYFDLFRLPFVVVRYRDELKSAVLGMDTTQYVDGIEDFSEKIGNREHGNACESICNILKLIQENDE